MLAKSHGNKSKADRKAKKNPPSKKGAATLTDAYNKADDLVELVYCDIANGVSRSVIIDKIMKGLYDNKPLKARQSAEYYNRALDRFAVDTDIEAERLRDMFYGRYEALLEEAVKKGDIYNARGILDSMAKIFLGVDKQQTNILINSDKEGGVTVNFGFEKKDED